MIAGTMVPVYALARGHGRLEQWREAEERARLEAETKPRTDAAPDPAKTARVDRRG